MTGLVVACALVVLVVLFVAGSEYPLPALVASVLIQFTLVVFAFAGQPAFFLVVVAYSGATAVNYGRVVRRQEPNPS